MSDEEDLDFGEQVDKMIAEGWGDHEIQEHFGAEAHEFIALYRVTKDRFIRAMEVAVKYYQEHGRGGGTFDVARFRNDWDGAFKSLTEERDALRAEVERLKTGMELEA